jgi:hypothetical protein
MDMKAISDIKAIVALESAADRSMTICTIELTCGDYLFSCSKNIGVPFV